MASLKPVIGEILPFDITKGATITFTYSGNQTYGYKYNVYNATTLSLVYSRTIASGHMSSQIEIPANASGMSNGVRYMVEVLSYDQSGEASLYSDKRSFWCISTATFAISNPTNDKVVSTSSIAVKANYTQPDDDALFDFWFLLYDSTGTLVYTSPTSYDIYNISYTFTGLDNNLNYYVQAKGTTTKGLSVETKKIRFYTDYANPTSSYSRLYLDADNCNGVVNYHTNIVLIDCDEWLDEDRKYGLFNSYIANAEDDFSNVDHITYSKGFSFPKNYTLAITHLLCESASLLNAKDQDGSSQITLRVIKTKSGYYKYRLTATDGISTYMIYSDDIPSTHIVSGKSVRYDRVVIVWITCINNVYQLTVKDYADINRYGYHYGKSPLDSLEDMDNWIDNSIPNPAINIDRDNITVNRDTSEPSGLPIYALWIGGDA